MVRFKGPKGQVVKQLFRIIAVIFRIGPFPLFALAIVLIATGIWQLTQGGIAHLPFVGKIATDIGIDLTAPYLAAKAIFGLSLKAGGIAACLGLIKVGVGQFRKPGLEAPQSHRASSLEDEIGRPSYLAKIPETAKPKRVYAFHEALQRRTGQSVGPAAIGPQGGGLAATLSSVLVLACVCGLGLVGASVLFGSPAGNTELTTTAMVAPALATPPTSGAIPDASQADSAASQATLAPVSGRLGDPAFATQVKALFAQATEWVQTTGLVWLNRTIDSAKSGDMIAGAKVGAMALGGILLLIKLKSLLFAPKRRRPRQSISQFC